MSKIDIHSRQDLKHVIAAFYQKAMIDDRIGHFFTQVIPLDLEVHLPRIVDFWESVLFGTAVYQGNPTLKHIEIHHLHALKQVHFDRWLQLWNNTINAHYNGPKAQEAMDKAKLMATLMMFKIKASEEQGFIQ